MIQALRLALGTASALGFARFAYGLLLPAMREDLHWSLAQAGAMNTANGLGYLIGALVTAAVVRRLGTAAAFRWGMALTAVALAATALTGDYAALLVLRTAAGITGAVVFIAGGVIAARSPSRGAIPVYFAGSGLGIVVSGAALPSLGDHWRAGWAGLGVAAGLATWLSWRAATDGDASTTATGRARVLPLWRTAVAYLLFAAGYITYITFLSAYLAEQNAPVAQVALTWTVLGAAVIAVPTLWRRPLARWPRSTALAVMLALLAGASALALVSPALPVVLASAAGYGATFLGVPAAITSLIKRDIPPDDWTATLAAFTTLFAGGQTAGPWIAGVLADHTSTGATVAWTAVLCGAGAVIALTARPPHPALRA
ncbi:YbfB/YjiJ family MFS transporter [Pseudonocardia zijingensis]|uniref:YbfB/YjiJ family MFS transporter n=1 Tax=Pseudonocardia zijingensis TaxID=153376 RepID=A0ABN1NH83_9PSEU